MGIDRCYIIGAGGTGSILLEPLTKLLKYHAKGCTDITVIDGDLYETKNANRQLFNLNDIGVNKATAQVERLSYMPNLKSVEGYITKATFSHLLTADDGHTKLNLVISAVDNLATRKEIILSLQERNEMLGLPFIYLNCGNSLDTAHVSVYAKLKKGDFFLNPLERYLDIANPNDTVPNSCAEAEPSSPQLITANSLSSMFVLQTVQNILDGFPVYQEINGWLRTMTTKPLGKPKILSI